MKNDEILTAGSFGRTMKMEENEALTRRKWRKDVSGLDPSSVVEQTGRSVEQWQE